MHRLVHRHGLAQQIGLHVVEQAHIGAFLEHNFKLLKRINLDLDLDQMPGKGFRRLQSFRNTAGNHDVVVLDQDRIIEPETMR